MDSAVSTYRVDARWQCTEVPVARAIPDLAEDVRHGFDRDPRELPPKYFYDAEGSRLFDRICDTPEYYPTRTEDALLKAHAEAVIERVRPAHLIELGSGASRKTRALLDACEQLDAMATYWPFDVCAEMIEAAAGQLLQRYDWLNVRGLVGDYTGGLNYLPRPEGRKLYVFLGGTIGNFSRDEAVAFLRELRAVMRPGDYLLMGADRVKDSAVLHAAYNDAEGLTAAFNRNVLRVINRELDADFDIDGFRHEARFDAEAAQIEMHLVAEAGQEVHVAALDRRYSFKQGDRIRTEISRKFTPAGLRAELAHAGLAVAEHFEPENGYFSLVLAEAK